jgi:hypothetical protein
MLGRLRAPLSKRLARPCSILPLVVFPLGCGDHTLQTIYGADPTAAGEASSGGGGEASSGGGEDAGSFESGGAASSEGGESTTTGVEATSGSTTGVEMDRVQDGLIAYYRPDLMHTDDTVPDISGVDPPLDMTLQGGGFTWVLEGLTTDGTGVVVALDEPTKLGEACAATDALTLEAWITPSSGEQLGPARIITYSPDTQRRNFMLGQGIQSDEANGWSGRVRTTSTSNNGLPQHLGATTVALQPTHLVLTRESSGLTRLFVDAELLNELAIDGDFSTWILDPTFRFAWGNEVTLDRPWQGTFHLVAIYERDLAPDEVARNFAAGH